MPKVLKKIDGSGNFDLSCLYKKGCPKREGFSDAKIGERVPN
jgi:hypothetical protein